MNILIFVAVAVFKAHAIGRHGLYNKNNLRTDNFDDLKSHALNYYGIPIVVIPTLTYSLFGPLVMTAHLVGVFATFRWNIYLRKHYHLTKTPLTPLKRFAWFRKKRALHFVHHKDARYNFAVVEFWMDNLLGTRKEA